MLDDHGLDAAYEMCHASLLDIDPSAASTNNSMKPRRASTWAGFNISIISNVFAAALAHFSSLLLASLVHDCRRCDDAVGEMPIKPPDQTSITSLHQPPNDMFLAFAKWRYHNELAVRLYTAPAAFYILCHIIIKTS